MWQTTFTLNFAPTAVAGDDQSGSIGDTFQLTGSGTDPEGDPIVSYLWSIDSAPGKRSDASIPVRASGDRDARSSMATRTSSS